MVVAVKDWTKLNGICVRIQKHCKKECSDSTDGMNSVYLHEFTGQDFESLFTDATKTALKPDALTLLKAIIKQNMINDAVDAEPSHRASFVSRIVDLVPLSYSRHGFDVTCYVRNVANFTKLLNYACDHPELFAYIGLGINKT